MKKIQFQSLPPFQICLYNERQQQPELISCADVTERIAYKLKAQFEGQQFQFLASQLHLFIGQDKEYHAISLASIIKVQSVEKTLSVSTIYLKKPFVFQLDRAAADLNNFITKNIKERSCECLVPIQYREQQMCNNLQFQLSKNTKSLKDIENYSNELSHLIEKLS